MKADENGHVEFITLPVEETFKVLEAMKQAEQQGDMEGLRWAARRIIFMANIFSEDTLTTDDIHISVRCFNALWEAEEMKDTAPASIAGIISRIAQEEPV